MKEILFVIGAGFTLISSICLIIKTIAKMVDPNEKLYNKMPPYWFFAVLSTIAGICLGLSYFLLYK